MKVRIHQSKLFRAAKNTMLLLLTAVYITALCGFAINTEYCEGKATASAISQTNGKCHCHHEQQHKDCCKDVLKYFKVNDNQNISSGDKISVSNSFNLLIIFITRFDNFSYQTESSFFRIVDRPPLIGDKDIFLRNCNLLI